MNSFDIAYKITSGNEGGYVLEDGDTGGETYCGVSRVNNPHWGGWSIVDKHKPLKKGQIIKDAVLDKLVKDFYKEKYWNPIKGDTLPSQEIANGAYDQAVNGGVSTAKTMLKAIGVVICLVVMCFASYAQPIPKLQKERDSLLIVTKEQALKLWRVKNYATICNRKPSQRKFLLGWINRAIK
jgi:hypothetical protein